MPLYEFRCTACGNSQDRLLSHAEADLPGPCARCGGRLQRRYSRVGVKLNAWGFSRTDGLVPDRPGRGDFRTVRDRAEQLSDES